MVTPAIVRADHVRELEEDILATGEDSEERSK